MFQAVHHRTHGGTRAVDLVHRTVQLGQHGFRGFAVIDVNCGRALVGVAGNLTGDRAVFAKVRQVDRDGLVGTGAHMKAQAAGTRWCHFAVSGTDVAAKSTGLKAQRRKVTG